MAAVLLLMNTYPLLVSEDLVFRTKAASLQNSVSVMVYSLSGLDQLDEENVAQAMAALEETGLSRILVTDSAGKVLYDTRETNDAVVGVQLLHGDRPGAAEGVDTSSSSYRDGAFRSRRHRRCSTRTRSSAPCTPMSTTPSRRRCWRGCRAICCGCPPASPWPRFVSADCCLWR